ncbi:tRNA nucleotidyltransferase [Legionella beliardensis]|uniref:Multifunctional CCA protein n=1 Tax=Legionella beliardensis TaxID=91822 RepID=A0A378I566_9GAMM|nr:multifunctional CCA addition/repair protein [Legionella beliardensis]STX29890.1 tRNA nucleotidyltransferase [Legionella beliardensis]
MKTYLVGGAVRDQLLNYAVKERDWVVVGATPSLMKEQGFQQVGRDFPVFLHPITREEYALARQEKKISPGYYGFTCNFDEHVTLEEDLSRRDLTINAIAMDDKGNIIDPFEGVKDIKAKKLRHVSEAFIEDPVRVLRVARFAARYHHLGFQLAEETRLLMYKMVKKGELDYLVPERVWQEWQRSLTERNPEVFIKILRQCDALAVILPEFDCLFGVPNPPKYHPEIDSGIHTLMVLQAAALASEDPIVRFAALLHDLGKGLSPMHKWPSHHGHEEKGVQVIKALCQRLRIPTEYRALAMMASQYHLMIHRLSELRAKTIVKVLEQTDAFRRSHLFRQLLLVCKADLQGRGKLIDYPQQEKWLYILDECLKISVQHIIAEGYQGLAIKEELHKRRVACVELIIQSWK